MIRTINRLQLATLIVVCLEIVPIYKDLQVHAYRISATIGHEQPTAKPQRILITSDKSRTQVAAVNASCFAIRGCK